MEIIYNPLRGKHAIKLQVKDTDIVILSEQDQLPLESAQNNERILFDGFLFKAALPLSNELKQIVENISHIDFGKIMNSMPELKGYSRKNSELSISDYRGSFHYDFTIANPEINDNPEAVRLHNLIQSLFTVIELPDWYDYRKNRSK